MVTSNPPLQNLDHRIRLTRSWRLSLAEEMEADVSDLEVGLVRDEIRIPRGAEVRAGGGGYLC